MIYNKIYECHVEPDDFLDVEFANDGVSFGTSFYSKLQTEAVCLSHDESLKLALEIIKNYVANNPNNG